ncbi:MAG: hypothetical protein JWR67_1907 [Mucilaginibacter sp.]|nr:hypothetical protein [Mucilaginibacter sp.]
MKTIRLTDLRLVYINQLFNASVETVFDAWLKPEVIKGWLFKSATNQIIDVKIDAKVGGRFSIVERSKNGETIDHFGTYRQFERPNLLIFTLEVPRHFPGVSTVTVDLQPTTNGCELNFTQTGVEPAIVEDNWREMLQQLNQLVAQ